MYLSKISISNYKGIEALDVYFSPKINIIIGENGCCKSALIDAIRLLYNLGEPIREITIAKEDFFDKVSPITGAGMTIQRSDLIKITYEFKELSPEQKGAFYEYMVADLQTQVTTTRKLKFNISRIKDTLYFHIIQEI